MYSHFFPTLFPLKTTPKFWAGENKNFTESKAEITKAIIKTSLLQGIIIPK